MSNPFRILVVCTGNICRSAQVEQLIRARIEERYPVFAPVILVESAGTGAMVGSGMPAQAAQLSRHYGGDPAAHIARQLTAEHVRSADLILAMASEHRSAAVRLIPRASRITFTLTEFAALLENAEQNYSALEAALPFREAVDKFRSAVKLASARRGYLSHEVGTQDDVMDPYRRSDAVYESSARQIVEALDRAERAVVSLVGRTGA